MKIIASEYKIENALDVGTGNTAGVLNTLCYGQGNVINGNSFWTLIGGYQNTINNADVSVTLGQQHNVTGGYGFVFGANCVRTHEAFVYGRGAYSRYYGDFVIKFGQFNGGYQFQRHDLNAGVSTTDATPTEIFLDCDFGNHRLTMFDYEKLSVKGQAIAKDVATNDYAVYEFSFGASRVANAASMKVDGFVLSTIYSDQPAWTITVTADTVNGRPAIKCTGETGKDIKWAFRLSIVELDM